VLHYWCHITGQFFCQCLTCRVVRWLWAQLDAPKVHFVYKLQTKLIKWYLASPFIVSHFRACEPVDFVASGTPLPFVKRGSILSWILSIFFTFGVTTSSIVVGMAFPHPNKFNGPPSFWHYICWGPLIFSERLLEVSFTPKLTTHDPLKTGCSFFLVGERTERVHGHPNRMWKPQRDLKGSCTAWCPLENMVHKRFSESILLGFSLLPFETNVWSIRLLRCLSK